MMEPSPDVPVTAQSVERIKVLEVSRQKHPVTQLEAHYSFADIKTDGPVLCHWRFHKEHVGLTVYGELQGCLLLECARCLEPYQVPVDLQVNERFVFEDSLTSKDKERELQSDDFYEVLDEEGELDLKDLAQQFLILESLNHPNCQRPGCRFA
jgi:uncharacterized metal-binding protein YceD (DUF177 family)